MRAGGQACVCASQDAAAACARVEMCAVLTRPRAAQAKLSHDTKTLRALRVLQRIGDDDWRHVMHQTANGQGSSRAWFGCGCRAVNQAAVRAEPDFETIVSGLLQSDGGDTLLGSHDGSDGGDSPVTHEEL